MKRIFFGPVTASFQKWGVDALQNVERWINTLTEFRGAVDGDVDGRDGSDGLVPQPKKGEATFVLHGDGKFKAVSGSGGGFPPGAPPGSIPIADASGNPIVDADFRYDPTTDTLYAKNVVVSPEVYGPGWDGDDSVPTKNDTYDAIQNVIASIPGGGGGTTVPVFYTLAPKPMSVTPGTTEGTIIGGSSVAVTAATKAVWIMASVSGSGSVKKKVRGNKTWSFEMRLKSGGISLLLGSAKTTIVSSGKPNPFTLSIAGAYPRVPVGNYNVVLISTYAAPIAANGDLSVTLMGQAP